jgi:hypothetical protein
MEEDIVLTKRFCIKASLSSSDMAASSNIVTWSALSARF